MSDGKHNLLRSGFRLEDTMKGEGRKGRQGADCPILPVLEEVSHTFLSEPTMQADSRTGSAATSTNILPPLRLLWGITANAPPWRAKKLLAFRQFRALCSSTFFRPSAALTRE